MLKSFRVMLKNLRLLGRSKGSALVVLFAPLLIVLIIGVSFTGTSETGLPLGVHAPQDNNLTQQYIQTLERGQNVVNTYDSEQACIQGITDGFVVTCIVFPENFEIDQTRRQEITFYVDESRTNLVYQLIANIGVDIDSASEEVSRELITRLLNVVTTAENLASESSSALVEIRADLTSLGSNLEDMESDLSNLDFDSEDVDISDVGDLENIRSDFDTLRERANTAVVEGESSLDANDSSTQDLWDALQDLDDSVSTTSSADSDLSSIIESLEDASSSLSDITSKLEDADETRTNLLSDFSSLQDDVDSLLDKASEVRSNQDRILSAIDSFEFEDADSIATPITTNIEPVTAENSQVTFIFPYLLMLVVLFVGIMLSSTLVFIEKDSKAFFRNYTTPTKTSFLTFMTYFTSMLIILIQVILIVIAANYLLGIPVYQNWEFSLLILFLSITTFIFIGMLIGHLFNTSEAITMGSITLSSIFLFLSNLVLPIETYGPQVRELLGYNPYILASEGLRKSMLLEADHVALFNELTILSGYIFILFILVIITQKLSKSNYFKKVNKKGYKDNTIIINKKKVDSLEAMHKEVKKLDKEGFERLNKGYFISKWVKSNFKEYRLSWNLRTQNKDKFEKALNDYFGKTKKQSKKKSSKPKKSKKDDKKSGKSEKTKKQSKKKTSKKSEKKAKKKSKKEKTKK